MSVERSIASHLQLAREALEGASTLGFDNHFAAYLAQQSVEQILLALALSESVHVPRSQHHQLDWIVRQFPEANAARDQLQTLTWLEAFATTYRYPRPSGALPGSPEPNRLRIALAVAEGLLQ